MAQPPHASSLLFTQTLDTAVPALGTVPPLYQVFWVPWRVEASQPARHRFSNVCKPLGPYVIFAFFTSCATSVYYSRVARIIVEESAVLNLVRAVNGGNARIEPRVPPHVRRADVCAAVPAGRRFGLDARTGQLSLRLTKRQTLGLFPRSRGLHTDGLEGRLERIEHRIHVAARNAARYLRPPPVFFYPNLI